MTALDPISEEVERFMDANIDSIDQLEILRVLGDSRWKSWRPAELAGETHIPSPTVESHLAALLARGLVLRVGREPDTSWRFGADTPEREGLLNRLFQAYRERPVTLIRMVYARPRSRVVALAEAFRIRKGD